MGGENDRAKGGYVYVMGDWNNRQCWADAIFKNHTPLGELSDETVRRHLWSSHQQCSSVIVSHKVQCYLRCNG